MEDIAEYLKSRNVDCNVIHSGTKNRDVAQKLKHLPQLTVCTTILNQGIDSEFDYVVFYGL